MTRQSRFEADAQDAGDHALARRTNEYGADPEQVGTPGKRTRVDAVVQRRASGEPQAASPQDVAHRGFSGGAQPLPHLETIQRSFGKLDVRGIRAYVGGAAHDAARQLGARAYASGDAVAFAVAPDLHTAAHEAAHVVQQRGGVQLAGGIDRPGDDYERHADQVAGRVVRGESAEDLFDGRLAGGGTGSAIQRMIGFEWEVDSVYVQDKPAGAKDAVRLPNKRAIFNDGSIRLETESGHIEFITEAAPDLKTVKTQLSTIGSLVEKITGNKQIEVKVPEDIYDDAGKKVWMKKGEHAYVINTGGALHGEMQATTSVKLEDVADLIKDEGKEGKETVQQVDNGKHSKKVLGLLSAVNMYLRSFADRKITNDDGPKTGVTLMARTDFHSMYLLITDKNEQQDFRDSIEYQKNPPWRKKVLLQYSKAPAPLLVGAWLDSIVDGDPLPYGMVPPTADKADGTEPRGADKDKLSPPLGYPAHYTHQQIPYAMGKYGATGDGRALFEKRDAGGLLLGQIAKLNFENFAKRALAFAERELKRG